MSWSPELPIGELRPWPDTVHVVRGRSGEMRRYVPERTCRILDDEYTGMLTCSECGALQDEDFTAYYCWSCGAKVVVK